MDNAVFEIEELLLSVLMKEPDYLYELIGKLHPKLFTSQPNRLIYYTILDIANRGAEPSLVLVNSELGSRNQLEKIGGRDYLYDIHRLEYNLSNLNEYVNIIYNAYRERELLVMSHMIERDLKNKDSIPDVLTRVNKILDSLTSGSIASEVVQLGEILDDSLEGIKERMKNPGLQGLTTGFKTVDFYTTGMWGGELWYIGARPSMGKTALLMKMGLAIAEEGNGFLLVNREMNLTSIPDRLYSMMSGVPLLNIRRGDLTSVQLNDILKAKDKLRELPFYIDNTWTTDDNYLYSLIRKYQRIHDIKAVGLDYIQLLADRDNESTHTLGRISRNLKLLSGELGIVSIVLSQLNRKLEERMDKRPLMADLRQSGNLEEDGDYMVGLYRDSVYNKNSFTGVGDDLEFIIRKARNGPIGSHNLKFDGETVYVYDEAEIKTL
jgi:replicative DNA helicase